VKIAYLCTDFGIPVHGTKGAAIHVRELSRALAGRGHDLRIYTPRAGGPAPRDFDVPVREIPLEAEARRVIEHVGGDPAAGPAEIAALRSMLYAATLPRRLAPELETFRPDAIYERYALFGAAGLALARTLGVPLLLEVNAPLSDEQAQHRGLAFAEAARGIERDLLQAADRVIVVSDALAGWAMGQGADPARVVVLPNAVDPKRFMVDAVAGGRERARIRAVLGAGDRPVIGFVGSLKPWHDVDALVRALGDLARRGTEAHLLVVGDGPERGALEARVRGEGLAAMTTFTGAVEHSAIPAWLAAMDIAVAPYAPAEDFYFSPLKLYEYLAAGRPVVAAVVGPLAAAIRHGETGWLYRAGDSGALADALATLIADPAAAAALGEAGQAFVRRHHTWDGNARAVVAMAGASAVDSLAGRAA
jgi:glycosyltransferase involved in cell wall biosynthesis